MDLLRKADAARHGPQMLGHVPTLLGYEDALIPDVQHFQGSVVDAISIPAARFTLRRAILRDY